MKSTFIIETNGKRMTIYAEGKPIAIADFGEKEITLQTIFHDTITTWNNTSAIYDYIEKEYEKYLEI
jgi:hypothetical protein